MVDMNGKTVELGDVTMAIYGVGDVLYKDVFCGKSYVQQGTNFDGVLFTTADGALSFASYYSGSYDAWGGISLAACPDMGDAAASLAQQFSVWAEGGANGTSTYPL